MSAESAAFRAVVRVTGTGRLEEFREHVRWLMVREVDAEAYTEHYAEGVLGASLTSRRRHGHVQLLEKPELRVEAVWEHAGRRGRAVIENGRLVEKE